MKQSKNNKRKNYAKRVCLLFFKKFLSFFIAMALLVALVFEITRENYVGRDGTLFQAHGECRSIESFRTIGTRARYSETRYKMNIDGEEFILTGKSVEAFRGSGSPELHDFRNTFIEKTFTVYYTKGGFFHPGQKLIAALYDYNTGFAYYSLEEEYNNNVSSNKVLFIVLIIYSLTHLAAATFAFICSLKKISRGKTKKRR